MATGQRLNPATALLTQYDPREWPKCQVREDMHWFKDSFTMQIAQVANIINQTEILIVMMPGSQWQTDYLEHFPSWNMTILLHWN